jgi:hypothetical protein
MKEEKIYPCEDCGQLPYMVKHTFDNCNEVHWSIKCSCKQTGVYRSFMSAEAEWEGKLYKSQIQTPQP